MIALSLKKAGFSGLAAAVILLFSQISVQAQSTLSQNQDGFNGEKMDVL